MIAIEKLQKRNKKIVGDEQRKKALEQMAEKAAEAKARI